jgi:hypothetical protein
MSNSISGFELFSGADDAGAGAAQARYDPGSVTLIPRDTAGELLNILNTVGDYLGEILRWLYGLRVLLCQNFSTKINM